MTAFITLKQREAVHILCDGAGYDSCGRMQHVLSKAFAIPHLSAVIATRGPAVSLPFMVTRLSTQFSSFDELVSGIESELPTIIDDSEELFALTGNPTAEIALIGWSEGDDTGKAYTILTGDIIDSRDEYAEMTSQVPFRLINQPFACASPAPDAEIMRESGFRSNLDVEKVVPERDLLYIMEMQRQSLIEYSGQQMHVVGGVAVLSTVTRTGITQRIVHRWPDEIGKLIQPEPIDDWSTWRAVGGTVGVSRLKREMRERKVRKGTLRLA